MDFGETQHMSCILGKESYAQLKAFHIHFPDLVVNRITTDQQEVFFQSWKYTETSKIISSQSRDL